MAKKIKNLHQVANELNIGVYTITSFLADKGFYVDNKPTAKLTEEMYDVLLRELVDEELVNKLRKDKKQKQLQHEIWEKTSYKKSTLYSQKINSVYIGGDITNYGIKYHETEKNGIHTYKDFVHINYCYRILIEKIEVTKELKKIKFNFYFKGCKFYEKEKQILVYIHTTIRDNKDIIHRNALSIFLKLIFAGDQYFISTKKEFHIQSNCFRKTGIQKEFYKPRYLDLIFNSIETFSCSQYRAGKDNRFYHRFDIPIEKLRVKNPNENFDYIFNLLNDVCKDSSISHRISHPSKGFHYNLIEVDITKHLYNFHLYRDLGNAWSESFSPKRIDNYWVEDFDLLYYQCIIRHNKFEEFCFIVSNNIL